MRWVIAYDIHGERARRHVARALERVGFRRQLSLFEGDASREEISALLDALAERLDASTDQLTAWPVSSDSTALIHRGLPRASHDEPWLVL